MNPRWDMLDEVSQAFVHQRWGLPLWGIAAVGAVVFIVGGLWWRQRWTSRHQRSHPMLTYLTLARQCGMTWRQQWTLWLIARHQGLESPMTLMFSPTTLRHHAQLYQDASPAHRAIRIPPVLAIIQTKLFGEAT